MPRKNVLISASEEMIREIMAVADPEWRGKTVDIVPYDGALDLRSYWDEGSRSYYTLIRLPDLKAAEVPAQHPMFDKPIRGAESYQMRPHMLVVQTRISRGKVATPTIYVHPANMSQLALPSPEELTPLDVVVLVATRGLKSSYGGISNYRYVEARKRTGITLQEWETTKADLIARKLLNKRGAITTEGHNALEALPGYVTISSLSRLR